MARFNSTSHLTAFAEGRGYPKIHDNLFNLIAETWRNGSFVDVCCSTGLLGQRLIDKLGVMCCGIDGDTLAIRAAREHGVSMFIHELVINEFNLVSFQRILDTHGVTALVFRRCISELFATGLTLGVGNTVQSGVKAEFATQFVDLLAAKGIEEIYLQGRAETTSAKHPIPNIYAELQFFLPHYDIQVERGQCAYLRRKSDDV